MRTFPGGYKKTDFDKKQDELAAKAAAKIRAQHKADLDAIEKSIERKLNEIKLQEAIQKFNALKDESKRQGRRQHRAA